MHFSLTVILPTTSTRVTVPLALRCTRTILAHGVPLETNDENPGVITLYVATADIIGGVGTAIAVSLRNPNKRRRDEMDTAV